MGCKSHARAAESIKKARERVRKEREARKQYRAKYFRKRVFGVPHKRKKGGKQP
jgi:hypothetical protein